jgi:hypothetical protein
MYISEIINEVAGQSIAVFYGGRFQPMHKGHFGLYNQLTSRFGVDNVFIATTFGKNQQIMHSAGDYSTDPFTFEEKSSIAYKMFDVKPGHIVDTRPYNPDVKLIGRDPETTVVVLAFSEKDAGRLKSGGALSPLPEDTSNLQSVSEGKSYFITMPVNEGGMSATDFRTTMADESIDDAKKQNVFQQFFGKFDQEVFDFIKERVS